MKWLGNAQESESPQEHGPLELWNIFENRDDRSDQESMIQWNSEDPKESWKVPRMPKILITNP